MRRRFAISAVLLLVALVAAAVAGAQISQKGNLRISFNGGFTPQSLPRQHLAPIAVSIEGAIGTTDGSHPPALRELEIELNRHGRISTVGLPVCSGPLLQSTTSQEALRRCKPALVGSGDFIAQLDSNEGEAPAKGRILAFNGSSGGRPALLLHFYATIPVQATLVLPLKITHVPSGQFGTLLSTKVPTLAGGLGSITKLNLKINRQYTYKGQKLSFVSASCAAPAGFPGAVFTFARGTFKFADGRKIPTPLSGNCHVR